MSSWSGIRKKLETEYLAPSLRGHIQYYATSYSRSPDHEGRAAIRYDGKEIIKGCYYNNWMKADLFPKDEKYEKRMKKEFAFMMIQPYSWAYLISVVFIMPLQNLISKVSK